MLSQIEQKVKEKAAQKAELERLQILKLNDLEDDEIKFIDDKIKIIDKQLNTNQIKQLNKLDNFLDSHDLDFEKIENSKFEYLLDNFIVKNEITMFAAPPASGKSLISVALANMFLINNTIKTVLYFDADNGITTLKERNIHKLKQKHDKRFRYFHESQTSKMQMWQIIKQLQKTDLKDALIVFDSIKNFMLGADRDKNKDVSKIMDVLKSLRARGASVLFLHHTNKPQKDIEELIYAGSSAWQEDTANAYILQKNNHKNTFIFKNFKKRVGDLHNLAFKYNDNHTLVKFDFLEASETQEIEEINSEIKSFIEEQVKKTTYSQIMQHLQKEGFPRNKSNQALQNGKDRYWAEEKLTQNNRSVYTLIKQSVVIEFEDIGETTPYKSDKSVFRASLANTPDDSKPYKWKKDCISELNPVIIHKKTHIEMPIL